MEATLEGLIYGIESATSKTATAAELMEIVNSGTVVRHATSNGFQKNGKARKDSIHILDRAFNATLGSKAVPYIRFCAKGQPDHCNAVGFTSDMIVAYEVVA